jgi:hypothetical protein
MNGFSLYGKSLCGMIVTALISLSAIVSYAQQPASAKIALKDIHLRDVCVLPLNGTYYMIGPGRGAAVVQYASKDLRSTVPLPNCGAIP